MSSNGFGTILRVSTFGESHGSGIGGTLEGCPSGIRISTQDVQMQLNRRCPRKNNSICTSRNEPDKVLILSGLSEGITLGTPIGFFINNRDVVTSDYTSFSNIPRPSHADYTYRAKYGVSTTGGGRSSARETAARVVAGTIARKFLNDVYHVEIVAWVSSVGNISVSLDDYKTISISDVDKNQIRCPDNKIASKMLSLIKSTADSKDSVGGTITCLCRNVPVGWGEPIFDKLEAMLAHAMLSIPATKGFEIGSGFSCAYMKGSQHNDPFTYIDNKIRLKTNNSGGVQGGISTGDDIIFRVAFKPPSSISLPQKTVDFSGNAVILTIKGRHDSCFLPRAVPIVEAMAALVLGDLAIRHKS